jgi:hypothetical protein
MGSEIKFTAAQTPPPKEVPVQEIAETLGLVAGLRAEKKRGGWRCGHCSEYQVGDNVWQVWVPDTVRIGDSAAAVSDQCRRYARNGDFTGWCLKCAKSLGRDPFRNSIEAIKNVEQTFEVKVLKPAVEKGKGWWGRLIDRLRG